MLERTLKVKRKFKEETEKGWKYGVRFSNGDKESLTLFFETESEVDEFNIDDSRVVKVSNPYQKLG